MVLVAYLGYPMVAALMVAFLLGVFAILRFILPGRPWFSSRNKPADVVVLALLAVAIAYSSQFATIAAA